MDGMLIPRAALREAADTAATHVATLRIKGLMEEAARSGQLALAMLARLFQAPGGGGARGYAAPDATESPSEDLAGAREPRPSASAGNAAGAGPAEPAEAASPAASRDAGGEQRVQAPQPTTVPAPPRPSEPSGKWTAERLALARRLWGEGVVGEAIVTAANTLPGPPIESTAGLFKRAEREGWQRPEEFRKAKPLEGAPPEERPSIYWSAERDKRLREGWAASESNESLRAALNALPGATIERISTVYDRAYRLRLGRRAAMATRKGTAPAALAPAAKPAGEVMWTPEREAHLHTASARGNSLATMVEAVRALPGLPIPRPQSVALRLHQLGLPRAGSGATTAAAPRPVAPAPEPAPPPAVVQGIAAPIRTDAIPPAPRAPAPSIAPPPVAARAAPPPPAAPESEPAVADRKLAALHDKARRMLRDRTDPDIVALHTKLPLREVLRLRGEMRLAAAAAAAPG